MDCPAIVHNMDTVRVDWDGIQYITSTTKEENQATRYVEANYSRAFFDSGIFVDGDVSFTGRLHPYKQLRFRFTTEVPEGMVPVIYDQELCFDPRVGKIIATYKTHAAAGQTIELDFSWHVDLFKQSDLNQDGIVDGADLGLLMNDWGAIVSNADINLDGIVDGKDLGFLLIQWDI